MLPFQSSLVRQYWKTHRIKTSPITRHGLVDTRMEGKWMEMPRGRNSLCAY